MSKHHKDGDVLYKGSPDEEVPEELQKMVDNGEALLIHKVENRWTGLPRTVVYAMLVGSLILATGVLGTLGAAVGYGIAIGVAFGITWQFTSLTKAYTNLRNLFEEHRAFNSLLHKTIERAARRAEGTFDEENGLSKGEDSSDTVH